MSAFLDVALKGDDRYRPLFRDHRVAGDWLPKTMYVTRFMDDSFRPLADFEEDIDVTSGSVAGVRLHGERLGTWREGRLELRSANRPSTSASQLNQALWLGWNNRQDGPDPADPSPPPYYAISLPAGLAQSLGAGQPGATVEMHVGGVDEEPEPRDGPGAENEGGDEGGSERENENGADGGRELADEEKPPLDLTVEAVDVDGDAARVRLGGYGPLRRPLKTRVLRRRDLEKQRFANSWELVLQHFSIPLSDFALANPAFDPATLRELRLVFDRTEAGTVAVDDVGLARMHPGFLAARLPPAGS